MKTKLLSLFVALIATTTLWASNVITYTATSKLSETTDPWSDGLHTNAFNVAISSHTFSDGTGTITFTGEVTTIGEGAFSWCSGLTSVTIPNSVTTIGDEAFSGCYGLTSVTIPNSVTTIGDEAFSGCSGLTLVTIGNSVTTIGWYAFYYCSSLTSITIPNSVTTIGEGAFEECLNLTKTNYTGTIADWCKIKFGGSTANPTDYSHKFYINDVEVKDLVIPDGVDTIGDYAFYECSGLTSVTIGNSVTTIGDGAFRNCSGLNSVTIPNSVTTIGDGAFRNCSGLNSVTIPNSVTTIGDNAFGGCSGLTSVTINANAICGKDYTSSSNFKTIFGSQVNEYIFGNSVTTIGDYAFYKCSGLTYITIPNSVTTIGNDAFLGCSGLTSITIPNSVTTIGYYAFYDCSGLTKTNYTGTIADWCKIKFGNELANPMYYSHNFYINDMEVKDLVIPDGVDTIGDYAFYGCSGLTSVSIPNSVTTIGEWAFSECSGLTSVTIPNSVTTIGDEAFSGCSGLTSITIGNSVTSIGDWAFYDCSGLTSVTIPNSVTTIGNYAFNSCSGLTKTNYTGTIADWCKIKFGNSGIANPMYYSHNFYINDVEVKDLVIPDGVDTIGEMAFYECHGLTSITIGNSVTTIGGSAFYKCSGLKSVTIGNSVTTIGENAFYLCSGLTSVTIGNSVTTIGNYAFSGCSGLTSVTIPNSVTTIGNNAFSWCSGLTSVTIPNSVTTIGENTFFYCSGLTSVTIPNSVTTIGDYAFEYCSGLASVTIPNSVTTIGECAFGSCSGLTSITIPNSVTTIGGFTFANCRGLTSVTIPNSIETIGDYAFRNCSGLNSITCEAITPPTCGSNSFSDVSKSIPVYVPTRSVDAYKKATVWKTFTNLQGLPNDYAMVTCLASYGMITGGGELIKGDTCTLTVTSNSGFHFTQWNDGNTDNPRSLVVTQDTTFEALFAISYSGKCGDNLYWQYNNDTLNITGSGAMYDGQPWIVFVDSITTISLPSELTTIGDSAFANIIQLNSIMIPSNVITIGANAFSGCHKLYDISCLATEPPIAQTSSFANYNVYLHVPCGSLQDYQMDAVFGSFKYIECISADERLIEGDQVIVTPATDKATITWPQTEDADTYTLEIKKNGELVCIRTFNSQGQLINIAFTLARNGERPANYATKTLTGYQFTVTGLVPGATYTYVVTAKDASQQVLQTYSGDFTTTGGTATDILPLLYEDNSLPFREGLGVGFVKFIHNGRLLIERNGILYNAHGARVE